MQKKRNKLGIYLECLSIDYTDSSYEVSADFCLENQSDRKKNIIYKYEHKFCDTCRVWGYPTFIDWELLEKEYTSNNMMKIQVNVW